MFYNKLTKAEKEKIIEKLLQNKRVLENNPTIIAYKKYLLLPFKEQENMKKIWDTYYEDVLDTPQFMIFQEQRKALHDGNIARVKELAMDAKKIREDNAYVLSEPKELNPYEFQRGSLCNAYRNIELKLKELIDESTDEEIEERNVWK